MRPLLSLFLLPLLAGCESVTGDLWSNVNYTEAGCGTKEAILTTTGCTVSPATASATAIADNNKPVSNPDDVNNSHNSHGSGK